MKGLIEKLLSVVCFSLSVFCCLQNISVSHLGKWTPRMCVVSFPFLCMRILMMEKSPVNVRNVAKLQFSPGPLKERSTQVKTYEHNKSYKAFGIPVLFICYLAFLCCVKTWEIQLTDGKISFGSHDHNFLSTGWLYCFGLRWLKNW